VPSSVIPNLPIFQSSNLPIFQSCSLPILLPLTCCRPGQAASRYPLRAMTCGSQLCHQRFHRAFASHLSSSKPTWFRSPGASCKQRAVVQYHLHNPNVILPASTQKGPASRPVARPPGHGAIQSCPAHPFPVSSYPTTAGWLTATTYRPAFPAPHVPAAVSYLATANAVACLGRVRVPAAD
jgi:hypothetical protein